MEIVIEVPDEFYKKMIYQNGMSVGEAETVVNAFYRGTPLPKGHGDLVDLKSLDRLWELDFYNPDSYYEFCTIMECGRILVEADEEGAEE